MPLRRAVKYVVPCYSARRFDADWRTNPLMLFDTEGSNFDADQHPCGCFQARKFGPVEPLDINGSPRVGFECPRRMRDIDKSLRAVWRSPVIRPWLHYGVLNGGRRGRREEKRQESAAGAGAPGARPTRRAWPPAGEARFDVSHHPRRAVLEAGLHGLLRGAGRKGSTARLAVDLPTLDQARPNRSRFITLVQAATKSSTNRRPESSHP